MGALRQGKDGIRERGRYSETVPNAKMADVFYARNLLGRKWSKNGGETDFEGDCIPKVWTFYYCLSEGSCIQISMNCLPQLH